MKHLVLMTTVGCHLCELAEQVIVATLTAEVVVEAEDIADSDLLIERYGTRIPVLVCEQSGQELAWPFDQQQLTDFVALLPDEAHV